MCLLHHVAKQVCLRLARHHCLAKSSPKQKTPGAFLRRGPVIQSDAVPLLLFRPDVRRVSARHRGKTLVNELLHALTAVGFRRENIAL